MSWELIELAMHMGAYRVLAGVLAEFSPGRILYDLIAAGRMRGAVHVYMQMGDRDRESLSPTVKNVMRLYLATSQEREEILKKIVENCRASGPAVCDAIYGCRVSGYMDLVSSRDLPELYTAFTKVGYYPILHGELDITRPGRKKEVYQLALDHYFSTMREKRAYP
jgi:hypothetical protein